MGINVVEWLDKPCKYMNAKGTVCEKKVVERLAELISVNGMTMHVSGWGRVIQGQGVYGRVGLTQPEALELVNLSGVMQGLVLGGAVGDEEKGMLKLRNEIMRVANSGGENQSAQSMVEIGTEAQVKRLVELKRLAEAKIAKRKIDSESGSR